MIYPLKWPVKEYLQVVNYEDKYKVNIASTGMQMPLEKRCVFTQVSS